MRTVALLSLLAPAAALVLGVGTNAASTRAAASTHAAPRTCGPRMGGFFDGLAAAFENDATLGDAGPAGLKKKAEKHVITWKGPEPTGFFEQQAISQSEAIGGQKLKDVANAAGIPIKYSCMEGSCGVCDVIVDGVRLPACTATCPKKDCTIEYAVPRGRGAKKGKAGGKVVPTKRKAGAAGAGRAGAAAGGRAAETEEEKIKRLQRQMMGEGVPAPKKSGGWPFG